jgi:hypothetical protein
MPRREVRDKRKLLAVHLEASISRLMWMYLVSCPFGVQIQRSMDVE